MFIKKEGCVLIPLDLVSLEVTRTFLFLFINFVFSFYYVTQSPCFWGFVIKIMAK